MPVCRGKAGESSGEMVQLLCMREKTVRTALRHPHHGVRVSARHQVVTPGFLPVTVTTVTGLSLKKSLGLSPADSKR